MSNKKKICVSQLQLSLSRTLNWATQMQAPVFITTRGKITHQISPVNDMANREHICACASNATEDGGSNDESQC